MRRSTITAMLLTTACTLSLGATPVDTAKVVPNDSSVLSRGVHLDNVVVYGSRNNFGVTSSQMSAVTLSKEQILSVPVFLSYLVYQFVNDNDQIIQLRHVHPNCSLVVSNGDVEVAKMIQDKWSNAKFYLDIPYSDVTKMYDSSSTPGLLPEIIINCPIKVLNPK